MRLNFALLMLGLAGFPASARAELPEPRMFSFGGFGTLGIVHSSEDQSDFTSTPAKPFGAGYTHAWSAEVDTIVAGQVVATFTPQLSGVLQVISEQNFEHSWRPHVEWANFRYQATPEFGLRAGRTVLPVLMLTDARKVGFANPWVRPPVEVYGMNPISNTDGVDLSYRATLDGGSNTAQLTVGRADSKFPGAVSMARSLRLLADTFERGPVTLRASYGHARITLPAFDALFDGFRSFGPDGEAIAEKFALSHRLAKFYGLGASYDPGPWFAMGEWVAIDASAALGSRAAWYLSAGRRIGKITPYVTYSRARSDALSDPGLDLSQLPPEYAAPAAGLNAGLNALLSAKVVQNTLSLGARWDFHRNAALKFQLDRVRVGEGSAGAFSNIQPALRSGGRVTLLSATLDFTF